MVILLRDFNPRAPCGARPVFVFTRTMELVFQSTRPVWGATRDSYEFVNGFEFQSTRPVWGATCQWGISGPSYQISIHAPRVGRDGLGFDVGPIHSNFNPRAPCGARPVLCIALYTSCLFQSTRPVWGATFASSTAVFHRLISIHAPRVGRDFDPLYLMFDGDLFQSTRPVWGATLRVSVLHIEQPVFQSTRPVWGATCAIIGCVIETRNFNPRAPCGARQTQ